jgi:hypothetical protein
LERRERCVQEFIVEGLRGHAGWTGVLVART